MSPTMIKWHDRFGGAIKIHASKDDDEIIVAAYCEFVSFKKDVSPKVFEAMRTLRDALIEDGAEVLL